MKNGRTEPILAYICDMAPGPLPLGVATTIVSGDSPSSFYGLFLKKKHFARLSFKISAVTYLEKRLNNLAFKFEKYVYSNFEVLFLK